MPKWDLLQMDASSAPEQTALATAAATKLGRGGHVTDPAFAWGKCAEGQGSLYHLVHHSADVAAVLNALLRQRIFQRRAGAALGRALADRGLIRQFGLAFLHDIGKLAPGFQAMGWSEPRSVRLRGHLECGWLWKRSVHAGSLAGAVAWLARWPSFNAWFTAVLVHHGRPVSDPQGGGGAAGAFFEVQGYDWEEEESLIGRALLAWFPPEIATSNPPRAEPRLVHLFCGLPTLADWIGSDRRAFPIESEIRLDYWQTTQERVERHIREIDLSPHASVPTPVRDVNPLTLRVVVGTSVAARRSR